MKLPGWLTDRHAFARLSMAAAVLALVAASLVSPVPGDPDHLTLFGRPFGQLCSFRALTGVPCPSCGMTRSWVWAARGELGVALRFNAAGVALLAGVVTHGVVRAWLFFGGALPRYAWIGAAAGAVAWMALWVGEWIVRLAGGYPLP